MILTDRLLLMREGEIVQQGTPREIYLTPADPIVADLFGPLNRWVGQVAQGWVDTPVGRFRAERLADGLRAVVLIRPEAIAVDPRSQGATVLERRLLGCFSAITVIADAADWHLRALVAGVFLPAPGTRVGVTADPARTFVFAAP